MAYTWQLTNSSLPTALNLKDGIGGCVLNGKMYAMGGWQTSGTRFNSVSYSTDGITWTPSAQTASWTPRHAMPVVVHNGKIIVLGGDQNGSAYQPDVHAWDGLETSAWTVQTTTAPWGNRAGHIGWSLGGYLFVGFGQTLTSLTAAPTKFFTDIWKSADDGVTWTKVTDECPINYRGYFSNTAPVLDGEAYFIGGGTYQTTDFTTREYKNDIFAIDVNGNVRLINIGKGSNLTNLMYHNILVFDGNLWVLGGYNGSNQNKVFMSADKGKTWTQQSTPPWAARHAALAIAYNDSLYFGTGESATDMYRLYTPAPSKYHQGATPDTTTGLHSLYTVIDETTQLINGKVVTEIGFYSNQTCTATLKIALKNSSTNFDIVYTSSSVSHSGGGWQSFPITSFTVPSTGDYRIGFAGAFVSNQSYSTTGSGRHLKVGDVTGTNQTFTAPTDGSFCMSWTEA